jgi:ornithine--oxo-acid transaminase
LKDTFHVYTTPLHLLDPRWYHLDTCFCPLDTGEAIWYPGAFDCKSQMLISSFYKHRLITVSEKDALKFACNSISVGNRIIMPEISDDLKLELAAKGYIVTNVDMSQFLRSGGACKCLTLELIK